MKRLVLVLFALPLLLLNSAAFAENKPMLYTSLKDIVKDTISNKEMLTKLQEETKVFGLIEEEAELCTAIYLAMISTQTPFFMGERPVTFVSYYVMIKYLWKEDGSQGEFLDYYADVWEKRFRTKESWFGWKKAIEVFR